MAEHEAFGPQLRFEVGPRDPGLESRELRQRIEPDQPPKPRHHDGERRPAAVSGRQMADDAGRAADRDRKRADVARPVQNLPDLVLGVGKCDAVDDRPEAAETEAEPVFKALADARPQARLRVPADQTMVGQPGWADAGEDFGEGRILRRRRLADGFAEEIAGLVGQVRVDRLIAPAIPSPHRMHPAEPKPHRPLSRRSRSRRRQNSLRARSSQGISRFSAKNALKRSMIPVAWEKIP